MIPSTPNVVRNVDRSSSQCGDLGHNSSRNEKHFFDNMHQEYFRTNYPPSLFMEIIRRISKSTDFQGITVLDSGCGQGMWGSYFSHCGADVIGVDVSYEALRFARAMNKLDVICADAKFLPFRDGCFDLVFCGGVLHHLKANMIVHSSTDMYRVTKGGGRVFTLDPNARCPYTAIMYNRRLFGIAKRLFGFGDLSPDESPLWPSTLKEIFSKAGFKGVSLTFAQVLPSTFTDRSNSQLSAALRQINSLLESTLVSGLGSIVCLDATR
jgi:SAM-dependent methyltransferase